MHDDECCAPLPIPLAQRGMVHELYQDGEHWLCRPVEPKSGMKLVTLFVWQGRNRVMNTEEWVLGSHHKIEQCPTYETSVAKLTGKTETIP